MITFLLICILIVLISQMGGGSSLLKGAFKFIAGTIGCIVVGVILVLLFIFCAIMSDSFEFF